GHDSVDGGQLGFQHGHRLHHTVHAAQSRHVGNIFGLLRAYFRRLFVRGAKHPRDTRHG
ncbi:unnamed protein product, partial [Phaeothamnion confervicola]